MKTDERFIVAIGSSAGGLKPMITFFNFTPHDHATYIILRHLPFNYQSKLQHILQSHSKLKIIEAQNMMLIEQDTVYTPPASMYMTIKNDRLYLEPRTNYPLYPNWSTNIFLSSLSREKGKKSIAIILSGSGTDGSKGANDIKASGGLVIAQSLESCEQTGMPLNAIKTGSVDFILDPEEMPKYIIKYIKEQ